MALGGTELAKAYVQIIPSAQGFSSKLKEITGGSAQEAGSSSGGSFGKSLLSKLGKLGIGMAIGKMVGSAFSEGAALQQSLGGIETLFKDSYETVKGYAQDAYKTAGLSANEYMETATSFSAGLISSLGGDTKKAADITDMAIKDMSDNANKMGTDMSMIQNAYQGFARQNYTMLDNLKLGEIRYCSV